MAAPGQSRQSGASCRSSHVRNALLATVGPKKAACRNGPLGDIGQFHSMTSSAVASSVGGSVRAMSVLTNSRHWMRRVYEYTPQC